MRLTRRFVLCALALLLAGSLRPGPVRAQFGLNIPGVDPKRAAVGAAAKQLEPYIVEQTPIRLDPVDLYPTVDQLPGAPFATSSDIAATARVASAVIDQLRHSTTGVVSLAPGDYAIAVRLFCMSHSRPARAPLAFLLGPMRGKRAPAIVAMNSRAASSHYQWHEIQTTSWTIQGGLGYGDFPGPEKGVVDTLIPDYESSINVSTLDDIQNKWSSLSNAVPGAPSLNDVLGGLGTAGAIVSELRDERSELLSEAADFDALGRTFAPIQASDLTQLSTPWSVVGPNLWMRMLTQGHYGDIGSVQIRVTGVKTDVPLVASIGYGRCQSKIVTSGSAYACTQPLSFVPQH